MDPTLLPLLLLLPPLMLVSAACSATETALFSLTHADRLRLRRESPASARAVAALLTRPRALLISILLVTNIANVAYFVVSSVIALAREPGDEHGPGGPLALAFSAASVLALIVLCDFLPKLFARRLRVAFCRIAAPAILAAFRSVAPVQRVLDAILIAPLSRVLRSTADPEPLLSAEELSVLLSVSAREGAIDPNEQVMLEDVVELSGVRVREAMTPRLEVPWIDSGAPLPDLLPLVRGRDRPRVVLCRGTLDDEIIGWADVKRALAAWAAAPHAPPRLGGFSRPMMYVPETARLDQLLEQFRAARRYTALCVDEYGTVVGMIDIDDVLTRLVGLNAAEAEGEREGVEPAGNGRWRVPGRFAVRELTGIFESPRGGITIRGRPVERRVSTVAGLVLLALGRVPRVGDLVRLGNVTLRVESMRGRTIERVLISVEGPPAPVPGAAA